MELSFSEICKILGGAIFWPIGGVEEEIASTHVKIQMSKIL